MTQPPVPADLDLRNFQYMPLDVVRLVDSDLTALSSGEEFKAAVVLWCKAWHQVPASSLPDDDRMLAYLAGYGRDVASWKKVRAVALRGFEKCSDGRLYHAVIAEKALEAADAKRRRKEQTEAATAARNARKQQREAAGQAPSNDPRNENRDDPRNENRDDPRNENRDEVQGNRREGNRREEEDDGRIARARQSRELFAKTEAALRAIPEIETHPVSLDVVIAPIYHLVEQGLDLERQIVPSIRRQLQAAKRPVKRWGYFVDGIVQDATATPTGDRPNGPQRRKTPAQQLADAFDRVEAHIAGRDPSS